MNADSNSLDKKDTEFKFSLEEGFKLAGTNGSYQYLITFLLLLTSVASNIVTMGIPLMETPPIVEVETGNTTTVTTINYHICEANYTLIKSLSKSSWVTDYGIFCDKFKVSLIGSLYCLGSLVGSMLVHSVLSAKGPKNGLIISAYMFSFTLFFISVMGNHLVVLYSCVFLFGLSGLPMFIFKINVISEITSKSNRPFLNNIIISAHAIAMMIFYFFFENGVQWRYIFYVTSIGLVFVTIALQIISVESPRHLYVQGKILDVLTNLSYIHKINKGISNMDPEFEKFIMLSSKEFNIGDKDLQILLNLFNSAKNPIEKIYHPKDDFGDLKVTDVIQERTCTGSDSIEESENEKSSDIENASNSSTKKNPVGMSLGGLIILSEESLLKYNFIVSFSLINGLLFLYNMSMKEYSYALKSQIYFISVLSLFSSVFVSFMMNNFGRKTTKILFLGSFMAIVYIRNLQLFDIDTIVLLFLINRIIISFVNMVNYTHLNETFPTKLRLKVFSLSYFCGKIVATVAPFILEYMHSYLINIILITCLISLILFLNQRETSSKDLTD